MEGTTTSTWPIGWIILTGFFAFTTLMFILIWIFTMDSMPPPSPAQVCFCPFGVQTNTDGNAINSCGADRTAPCLFAVSTLAEAETQCNTLSSICTAFTFNDSTSTMKIVRPDNTFSSMATNLYVRQ